VPSNRTANLVVVVEDDDALREMIRELLEMVGFATVGCPDGYQGIKAVRDLHPSVVTLDLHMPGMDGVEVLDHLAEDEATAEVPVVVVSAYSSDSRLRTRKQIKAILQKPFDVDELCRIVRKAANDPEGPDADRGSGSPLPLQPANPDRGAGDFIAKYATI
jgi:CheY-like chemotaxis protein